MKLYNPFTHQCIEYPLDFDLHVLNYHIQHETPFSTRFSEWAVSVLENGDYIYIPYGDNRCPDIYIVTALFIKKVIPKPHGIYTIPMSYFMEQEDY